MGIDFKPEGYRQGRSGEVLSDNLSLLHYFSDLRGRNIIAQPQGIAEGASSTTLELKD